MSTAHQKQRNKPTELLNFLGYGEPPWPKGEEELGLQESAIAIARSGDWGIRFLLDFAANADEQRLRAILIALSLLRPEMVQPLRARVCSLARGLLGDQRPLIVAEAVDTLASFGCRTASKRVTELLAHPSPYVAGSALRFFARLTPGKAVRLLEQALASREAIVRQNAIDELDALNHKPALEKIRLLLRDANKDVRQAARAAVANLEQLAK